MIVRLFFNFFLRVLDFLNVKRKFHIKGIMVSYTHEVREEDLSNFENLILKILETHSIISPNDFFNYYEKGMPLPLNSILMTFDDGFLSSYNATISVLNKYNIKAIFFIPTKIFELRTALEMREFTNSNIYYGKLEKDNPEDYLFMQSAHVVKLVDDGHYIAAHTHNHVIVKDIRTKQEIYQELIYPKKYLNTFSNDKRSVIAVPVGTEKQINKFIFSHIRSNYDYCFTTLMGINNTNSNRHLLYRFNLPPDSTLNYLKSVLEGSYFPYYFLKMLKLKLKVR